MVKTACAVLTAALAVASPAWADPDGRVPIPTLFDTGVDASGHVLADGTAGDPHYTLSSVPYPSASGLAVLRGVGPDGSPPIGPWAGNDDLSAWISPGGADVRTASTVGEYFYTTSFDLSGFDPASALIYGAWAADDIGAELFLNGQPISILTSRSLGPQNYDRLNTFNYYTGDGAGGVKMVANAPLQTGFVPGINTLTFRADNAGGPTGLRVEMIGTAVPVPEPSSLALLGAVLFGLAAPAGWARAVRPYARRRYSSSP